jgi:ribonuclease G
MNKELFVSSTPHETKVGLVEDDLLAEIYLERENEYTLAGSIYKGRVTRVLPGMQSAFVDIGLERDAFLYVSDFMELEEHDEDLTDSVPANRPVHENQREARPESGSDAGEFTAAEAQDGLPQESAQEFGQGETRSAGAGAVPDSGGGDSQNRDRGVRGRRRRRGGRRDGRPEGRDRNSERSPERAAEPRASEQSSPQGSEQISQAGSEESLEQSFEPGSEQASEHRSQESQGTASRDHERGSNRGQDRGGRQGSSRGSGRGSESRRGRSSESSRSEGRSEFSGPPPGYQPILLPGESISKYRRLETAAPLEQSRVDIPAELSSTASAPLNSSFPEDEPVFAAAETVAEPLHEEHEDIRAMHEEPAESASVSTDWNQEFRRADAVIEAAPERSSAAMLDQVDIEEGTTEEETLERGAAEETLSEKDDDFEEEIAEDEQSHHFDVSEPVRAAQAEQSPSFAAPGTMEEETIDDEEAEAAHYESSSDEGYEEFEEETRAAGSDHLNGDARDVVTEIHMSSLTEAAQADGSAPHVPEGEEDSEELELEEAQAEAEALLDAESRGNGTVDARVEVRAPSPTAGLTQRAPRPAWERRGQRGRRGGSGGGGPRRGFRRRESAPVPLISDLLKEGQEILVQIAKEPIGKKGARITSHIALPGRFLVYMPTVNHTGVSRKIASDEERQRLKRIILSERDNGHGGFIVRTAAQNASEDELRADIRFLKGLWNDIKGRSESSKPPALIYHDLNVVERVLRDQVTSDFNVIWVDTEPEYERILRFFNRFQPGMMKRVKLYTKETPLFEQFGLAEEMNKALKSKVWLKSGGYIVINQTEALVAIDINTGKYVGKTARLEDTIVKTNVDAIKEIVRQIRLRDLGGIIIIDFIDMDERRNRQRVMQALEEELRHDRAPSKTLQFNDFGLVAITRKRVKQSLERTIGAPCPYCESTGYVKSITTVCNEIYVEMRKIAKHLEHEDVMLRVHPDVAKELKSGNGRLLNEMEEMTKRTIIVKSDPAVHQQQFDIN